MFSKNTCKERKETVKINISSFYLVIKEKEVKAFLAVYVLLIITHTVKNTFVAYCMLLSFAKNTFSDLFKNVKFYANLSLKIKKMF